MSPSNINDLSNVGKLVHLAMRFDSYDEDRIKSELTKSRRRAYERELTNQARRAGCSSRSGRVSVGPELSELNRMSGEDAKSIVTTYNKDLAAAIRNIRAETPTANRNVYVKRLMVWEDKRSKWKASQIAQNTEATARRNAQRDFVKWNNMQGKAILRPTTAVCPVCRGWIRRGLVPLDVAQNKPPPYHINCPHYWENRYEKFDGQCSDMWMGD